MLPYFKPGELTIYGDFSLKPFGILVVSGIVAGYFLSLKRAKEKNVPEEELKDMIRWTVGVGLILAHVLEILLYQQDRLAREGVLTLFKFWDGLSSFGGLLGAFLASHWYARKIKRPWRVHADFMIQGWVLGWVFGRLGCTIVHDHPGSLTDFFLAFNYPAGARHNLGFYEMLYTALVMLPGILLYHRKRPGAPSGTYVVLITLLYTPFRFFLDFLRAVDITDSDTRYLGLTPAQYGCFGFFVLAAYFWTRLKSERSTSAVESARITV